MTNRSLSTFVTAALLLLAIVPATAQTTAEQETYAEAERKAEEGSSDPAVVSWYSEQMQPEFSKLFERAVGQCLSRVPAPRPKQVDLVFTVKQDGSVGRIYWKDQSPFTACLEDFLRNALFPSPPQPVFYFGVGADLPEGQENP